MNKLMMLILMLVTLTMSTLAQSNETLELFPYAKGAINGTYWYFDPPNATIVLHAGTGQKATAITMFGHSGLMGILGREVRINGRVGVYINNYRVVIGEPNSAGPGYRTLSVANDPERSEFDFE